MWTKNTPMSMYFIELHNYLQSICITKQKDSRTLQLQYDFNSEFTDIHFMLIEYLIYTYINIILGQFILENNNKELL